MRVLPEFVGSVISPQDVDGNDFQEQAVKYDFKNKFDALLWYLETCGEVDDDWFPERDEFQELAADYKVLLRK